MGSVLTTSPKRDKRIDPEKIARQVVDLGPPVYICGGNGELLIAERSPDICIRRGKKVSMVFREKEWKETNEKVTSPLVERAKSVIEEVTGLPVNIEKTTKITYDVYLGDLIPLGEVTGYRVTLKTHNDIEIEIKKEDGNITERIIEEKEKLRKVIEEWKKEISRRIPELEEYFRGAPIFHECKVYETKARCKFHFSFVYIIPVATESLVSAINMGANAY